MSQHNDRNRGALFRNDKQGNDRAPDYKGPMNFNGQDGYLAAWLREAKNGQKYMSLSWEAKDKTREQAAREAQAPLDDGPYDDSIPF